MKKLTLFFVLLFVSIILQAQKEFTITGNVPDMENSVVYITRTMRDTVDISPIRNGSFVLKGSTDDEAECLYLVVVGNGQRNIPREIWITPGEVNITGKNTFYQYWDVQSEAKVQKELNQYITACYDDYIEMAKVDEKLSILYKNTSGRNITDEEGSQLDTLRKERNDIYAKIRDKELELLAENDISDIWMDKLSNHTGSLEYYRDDNEFVKKVYSLYNRLSDEQKNSRKASSMKSSIELNELIGKPVEDVDLKDLDGNIHHLSEHRGKYILIDFWASWCRPCIMAFPQVEAIVEKYGDKLSVVNINLDGNYEKWKEATEKHKIIWTNLSEGLDMKSETGLHKAYKCVGIPYYLLLSREGNLLGTRIGFSQDQKAFESWVLKYMK